MLGIHTINFTVRILSEEEAEIVETIRNYTGSDIGYDRQRKRHVFLGFADQGLRIFLWKRTNEVMRRERQLEYVLNPKALLENGELRYAFYGGERELELALYRADRMLSEIGLPGLDKKYLERIDCCIDIRYDSEKTLEEAMRLVRKHGIPRGYRNFYKGTSRNNRYSLEAVKNATGERLVIYDKTHQLREAGVDTGQMDPTVRVEYKANRKSWDRLQEEWEDWGLAETILICREYAEGKLKAMTDGVKKGTGQKIGLSAGSPYLRFRN